MSEWREYRLDEIGQVVGGGTPSSKVNAYWNGDVGWVTPADLSGYQFKHIGNGSRDITELGLKKSSAKLHPKNTVLMTSRAPIGYLAIADKPVATNQGFQSIRCNEDIADFNFIYYLLGAYKEGIALIASGATFPEVSGGKVRQYKIKLPPLPTQQKIAKILSNYDDLIENNLKRIKLLEESARLTYEEWFLRFRIDGKKLDIDPESGLPFGWLNKSFGDVFNINNGYAFKSGDYAEHGVPILRTRDYSQTKWIKIDQPIYISEELSQKYTKYYVQEYDLMLIMVGASIGNYGVVLPNDTGLLQNQNQWAIRVNNGFEKYIFYKLLMMEDLIKNLLTKKTGAARDFFRASFLKELDILLPDEDTVTLLNKTVQPTFEEINNLQHQNQLLKEARDILLPRLMTGMIDTDELDIAV